MKALKTLIFLALLFQEPAFAVYDCSLFEANEPKGLQIGFSEGVEPLYDRPIRDLSGVAILGETLLRHPAIAGMREHAKQRIKFIIPTTNGGINNFSEDLGSVIWILEGLSLRASPRPRPRVRIYQYELEEHRIFFVNRDDRMVPVSVSELQNSKNPGPIVIWTDFGLLETSSRLNNLIALEQWSQFLDAFASSNTPVLVITPIPSHMIPSELTTKAQIVSLDSVITDSQPKAELSLRSNESLRLMEQIEAHLTKISLSLKARANSVFELAVLASLAGRIEPQLLREIREKFMPSSFAIDESLVSDSHLVQTRAATGLILKSDIAKTLREELAHDSRIDDIWSHLFELRSGIPWAQRSNLKTTTWLLIFEELNYWGIKGVPSSGPDRIRIEGIIRKIGESLDHPKMKKDTRFWLKSSVGGAGLPPAIKSLQAWTLLEQKLAQSN